MADARVDRALVICTTLEEFASVQALAVAYDNFWASAGVHPDSEGVEEPTVERLIDLAQRPRVVAVGETGLDYYRIGTRHTTTCNGSASASAITSAPRGRCASHSSCTRARPPTTRSTC